MPCASSPEGIASVIIAQNHAANRFGNKGDMQECAIVKKRVAGGLFHGGKASEAGNQARSTHAQKVCRENENIAAHRLSTPSGIRIRVATLKGWCPRPLDDGGK